jgi:Domain of unknown function (DUF4440)
MKSVILAFTMLLSSLAFGQSADPTATPTDCTNSFFKAMLDEDAGLMSKVLAADFTITSFDGQLVDADLLGQAVNGGFVIIETGTTSRLRTRTYNDNAAIVTGNWRFKGAIQGNNLDTEITFGAVCVKIAGAWKMVNMQFTPIK